MIILRYAWKKLVDIHIYEKKLLPCQYIRYPLSIVVGCLSLCLLVFICSSLGQLNVWAQILKGVLPSLIGLEMILNRIESEFVYLFSKNPEKMIYQKKNIKFDITTRLMDYKVECSPYTWLWSSMSWVRIHTAVFLTTNM